MEKNVIMAVAAVLSTALLVSATQSYLTQSSASTTFSPTKKYPHLKLYYFDIPGKGEAIRLICAHYKIPLRDVRLTPDEFAELKKEGKLKFGQLPALEVDNSTVLVQSAGMCQLFFFSTNHS